MKTKVLQVNIKERQKAARTIEQAAKAILQGEVLVYPTDTAYGMGADATNAEAVKKVFKVKKRDENKPLPVIVSDLNMMREYGVINPIAEYLANAFMPGPLALLVEKTDKLPHELSPQGVVFRVPSNHFARAVASAVGKPITATSANISGETPLYREADLIKEFDGKVPVILSTGDLAEVLPSTILDTRSYPPKMLRQGPISEKEIQAVLAKVQNKETVE